MERLRALPLAAIAVALVAPDVAEATATVTPTCADPGQSVTFHNTASKNASTKQRIMLGPTFYDPKLGNTTSPQPSDYFQVAEAPLVETSPGSGTTTIDATFKLPTTTTFKGQPIEAWGTLVGQYDDANTFYGYDTLGEVGIDLTTRWVRTAPTYKRINQSRLDVIASGFGTSTVYAHLVNSKGKRIRSSSMGRSLTSSLACGRLFKRLPALTKSKFPLGTYTVVANTSPTNPKAAGGATTKLKVKR